MNNLLFTKVVKPPYVRARRALEYALFDRRFDVDTDGFVTLAELGVAEADCNDYKPAKYLSLRRILPPREVTDEDVFIDFGSGKGRVVLQAAFSYPFRRVYGVELAEELHRIALHNVEVNRDRLRCRDVRLTLSDVLDYEIPDDVTVAFFYNPFGGEVFETVIRRLLDSVDRHPRPLRVVYGNPREEEMLLRTGRFRQIRALRGWRPGRDWSRSNSYRLYAVT